LRGKSLSGLDNSALTRPSEGVPTIVFYLRVDFTKGITYEFVH
jgi:hypothetical protein